MQVYYRDESPDAMLHRIRTAESVPMSPGLFEKLYLSPQNAVKGRTPEVTCHTQLQCSKRSRYTMPEQILTPIKSARWLCPRINASMMCLDMMTRFWWPRSL